MTQEERILQFYRASQPIREMRRTKLSSFKPTDKGYLFSLQPQSIRKAIESYSFRFANLPIYSATQPPAVEQYVTAGYVLSGYVENT